MNYNNLLKPLIETSYLAGEKILEIYNDNNYKSSIEIKKDASPLTIADKASNNVIVNSLNKIIFTPYHAIRLGILLILGSASIVQTPEGNDGLIKIKVNHQN